MIDLITAVKNYHYPQSKELFEQAKRRFKFEEMFYIELLVAIRKNNYQTMLIGNKMEIKTNLISEFIKTLSFELTYSQLNVLSEIKKDMLTEKPMNRLLQGDVGSGKTIVALIAIMIAVDNGYQAALMAPTEILADRHAKNISAMMSKLAFISKGKEIKVSSCLADKEICSKSKTF